MREYLNLFLLAIIVFFIYSNTLEAPFILDSKYNIQQNNKIRLTELTLGNLSKASFESPMPSRPLSNLSFALNYYFHQYNVKGYHLVNILIHITTGFLFYFFAKATLDLPVVRSRYGPPIWIPFIAAFIWLVHPIQTQSVTYIVQRMNSMSTMFYLLSILLYIKARLAKKKRTMWPLFAGCVTAGILALASKEIAATLPFFIFLYEWYFFQDLNQTWLKRYSFLLLGILIFLFLLAFMFMGANPFNKLLLSYEIRDFTMKERVLTESRVVIFYLSQLVFPHPSRLNLNHHFPFSHSLVDPLTTLLSLGTIIGLIGMGIVLAKNDRLISFCILWFFGNLVIESSVIGLEIIFEHRTYLPSLLVCFLAVIVVNRYLSPNWIKVALVCAVGMIFGFWTYQRNSVWGSNLTFWADSVKKSPEETRSHNNLGIALQKIGRYEEAIAHYSEALRIKPDYETGYNNLGSVLLLQGKTEEAMANFSKALRIKPNFPEALHNMGKALLKLGKLKESIEYNLKALSQKTEFAEAHYDLGTALSKQGKLNEGIEHFLIAIRYKPDDWEPHYQIGIALNQQGKISESVKYFYEASRINSQNAAIQYSLGLAFEQQGKFNEAIKHYSEALRIEPDSLEINNNLGIAYVRQGKVKKGITHFKEALRINANDDNSRNNLNRALSLLDK